MRASFEEFHLDTTTFELRRDGEPVPLEPQVFDVLAHLVRHRDRVVSKEELLDEVWGDRFVSESALTSRIKHVRQALGDDGRVQRYVKTVHGRGYRFAAEVTTLEGPDGVPAEGSGLPAPPGSRLVPHNLPTDRTPLFGRDEAIPEVADLIGRHRLVSLLGIGGTGKTRLASAVGHHVLERFPDGVWFVDLVPAGDERAVETAVAHAAGLALSAGETRAQLAQLIASRTALFVLDNCEHVRDEVAATLDHLLEHTGAPRFLVTSREPLDLPDERRVNVEPLAVGDLSAPAITLFLSSAERFGTTVAERDHPTVERICRHLDGLPLAIELAAAQLRLLRPDDVADRLDQRFELLRARRRPGRERHASLTSVLEDTWALLDPDEQELLGQLAAFPGPFDLLDVEELAGDLPPGAATRLLGQLVDRGLVVGASAEETRFRLLETVRLFVGQRTDTPGHAERHARWCLDRVGSSMQGHLYDFALATWCARHYDDIRAAERHLLEEGRVADAAMLVAGTALAMHVDAGARAADILLRLDAHLSRLDDPTTVARLRLTGVHAAMATRSPDLIAEHGRGAVRAAEASGDPALLAVALVLRSWSTIFADPARALKMVEEARELATSVGDASTRDQADSYRAFHLAMMHRYEEAVEQAEAVIERAPALDGYGSWVAVVALTACDAVHRPERARRWIHKLLGAPSPDTVMWGTQVLCAAVHASNGNRAEALSLVETVHTRLAQAGQESLPDLLVPAAVLAHRLGDDARAARWLRAVRDAGRPTQSFPVTCVYHRTREIVGTVARSPIETHTLEEIGDEALAWMRAVVER